MKTRRIKKIAVIGSGIMGSGIACHFANIGVDVLLLDIVPRELNDKEIAKGLTLEDKVVRNRLVNDALTSSLKSKPSPIYHQKFSDRITTGNLDDDIEKVAEVDWIMEVVIERLDIKKMVFEKLEKYHINTIAGLGSGQVVSWFGEDVSPCVHLCRLLAHETLHHGQLILYWRALGHPFPESWANWGEG